MEHSSSASNTRMRFIFPFSPSRIASVVGDRPTRSLTELPTELSIHTVREGLVLMCVFKPGAPKTRLRNRLFSGVLRTQLVQSNFDPAILFRHRHVQTYLLLRLIFHLEFAEAIAAGLCDNVFSGHQHDRRARNTLPGVLAAG